MVVWCSQESWSCVETWYISNNCSLLASATSPVILPPVCRAQLHTQHNTTLRPARWHYHHQHHHHHHTLNTEHWGAISDWLWSDLCFPPGSLPGILNWNPQSARRGLAVLSGDWRGETLSTGQVSPLSSGAWCEEEVESHPGSHCAPSAGWQYEEWWNSAWYCWYWSGGRYSHWAAEGDVWQDREEHWWNTTTSLLSSSETWQTGTILQADRENWPLVWNVSIWMF